MLVTLSPIDSWQLFILGIATLIAVLPWNDCYPEGLSPPVGDYYPFRGQGIITLERELSSLFVE